MALLKFIRTFKSIVFVVFVRPFFLNLGKRVRIHSPLKISGAKNISIGSNVTIEYKTWLAAVPINSNDKCNLSIGSGCVIGHFNHIYATKSIKIEENVLTADKVYISDNLHGYENVLIPVKSQEIIQKGEVIIGSGSWIGENVCILGVRIGRNCVIGANSVVTQDIPDYSVAVGAPAKVIKYYDLARKEWVNCKKEKKCKRF